MSEKPKIAIVGGDARFYHLANMLAADGWTVQAAANKVAERAEGVKYPDSPRETVQDTAVVVLPLPVLSADGMLNAGGKQKIDAYALLAQLPPDCLVCGGLVPSDYTRSAARHALRLVDYNQREEFAVANCVPTAEGAIEIALRELPETLHGMKTLVIGWGRVGKALAVRLHALGAQVTVSARKPGALAEIAACGMKAAHTGHLVQDKRTPLREATVIFNTVPYPILSWEELAVMRPDCLYIELASVPGGLDAQAAEYSQLRIVRAPGLPGFTAPVTAAGILRDTLYHIWQEQGVEFPGQEDTL